MIGGEARQCRDQLGQRRTVGRRRPSYSAEQRRSLELVNEGQGLLLPDRDWREGDVAQNFDMDAAEPDHQHRAESGIPRDAEDDFAPRRRHRLDQDAVDDSFRERLFGAPQHPFVGFAYGRFAEKAKREAACLGLVGDIG